MKPFSKILLAIAAAFTLQSPIRSQAPVPRDYFALEPGVYGQWCWNSCVNPSRLYGAAHVGLKVYCRDIQCGLVSATVSFWKNDAIVDQRTLMMTLNRGQQGVMVFQSLHSGIEEYSFDDFQVLGTQR